MSELSDIYLSSTLSENSDGETVAKVWMRFYLSDHNFDPSRKD